MNVPPAVRRVLRPVRRYLPGAPPRARGIETIVDLYVWMLGPEIDTVVPVQNYFSAFFPELDTATSAVLHVSDADGVPIASRELSVPAMGAPLVRVSELVSRPSARTVGTLSWYLRTPPAVRDHLRQTERSFLFWDRSYIGYEDPEGRLAFVHGVDKTEVVSRRERRRAWPVPRERFQAKPELPVVLHDGEVLDVALQNRARSAAPMCVRLVDEHGGVVTRTPTVAGRGVALESFTGSDVAALDTAHPLRLEVDGLTTRFGRPIVVRRFPSGAFSLMHC